MQARDRRSSGFFSAGLGLLCVWLWWNVEAGLSWIFLVLAAELFIAAFLRMGYVAPLMVMGAIGGILFGAPLIGRDPVEDAMIWVWAIIAWTTSGFIVGLILDAIAVRRPRLRQ